MKKLLALLLCLAMCTSLAACGGSENTTPDSEETKVDTTEVTQSSEADEITQVQENTEAEDALQYITVFNLSEEEVNEIYDAILNGEITGEAAEHLKTVDSLTAKITLDFLTDIFNTTDVIGVLADLDSQEIAQITAESRVIREAFYETDEETEEANGDDSFMAEMGTTMVLYDGDLDRSIVVELNPDHAFMEPDWVMMTDAPDNFFISIDNNYEVFTLTYGAMDRSTDELIEMFLSRKSQQGIDAVATEVVTFQAGGIDWEVFDLVYERTSTGIDKETNQEVTLTSTIYETICFARPDSETALQIDAGSGTSNPESSNFYRSLIENSILSVQVQ